MKYAIVTGATRGIGRAIAEKFLTEGLSVAICARNSEDITSLMMEWGHQFPGSEILAMPADLRSKEGAEEFADGVLAHFPRVDVLVNNAGTYKPGDISTEPDDRLEKLLNINLFSAYHLTRKILPAMKFTGTGHIFNVSSIAGIRPYPGGGSYSISKYALQGFSENLRLELQPLGIKVTTICPGAVYTSSWDGSGVPPERIMEAADIAKMVWAAFDLSAQANVDHIVMRPALGDL